MIMSSLVHSGYTIAHAEKQVEHSFLFSFIVAIMSSFRFLSMETEADLVSKLRHRKINAEPNWITGNLSGYHIDEAVMIKVGDDGLACLPVQQSDSLKPIYMDIVRYGLNYAYQKYKHREWLGVVMTHVNDPRKQYEYTKTDKPKNVIIVGAGIAGLAAAYELAQVGHHVQILEMQERVGGRIKTYGEKDGFAKHLYVDGETFIVITVKSGSIGGV